MTKPMPPYRLWIGWDAHQLEASVVAQMSAAAHSSVPLDVRRLALPELVASSLYTRPTVYPTSQDPGYFDNISEAPMSTSHAIARFLVPTLCDHDGWALFTDGDVLFRHDLQDLFALADDRFAVHVVQHHHVPSETAKMEGQIQTRYARKNWSSVMLFNCGHPANRALNVELVNSIPGRDLHRFCWLEDDLIGALPAMWNVLIGEESDPDPAIAHFTLGLPSMRGYGQQPFADEWFQTAKACGYTFPRFSLEGVA